MNINLSLPKATVDACLVALSKFPWEQSNEHIVLIRGQRDPQVLAAEAAQAEIDPETEKAGGTD